VVVAAGIARAERSPREFLVDPSHMDELIRVAPKDWEHKNMEIVIETQVIDGLPAHRDCGGSCLVVSKFCGKYSNLHSSANWSAGPLNWGCPCLLDWFENVSEPVFYNVCAGSRFAENRV